jgi:uncharacterized OB-fold protein
MGDEADYLECEGWDHEADLFIRSHFVGTRIRAKKKNNWGYKKCNNCGRKDQFKNGKCSYCGNVNENNEGIKK